GFHGRSRQSTDSPGSCGSASLPPQQRDVVCGCHQRFRGPRRGFSEMTDLRAKRAILAALSHEPDFSALGTLPPLETAAGRRCSQWLDRSGLALRFFRKLQCHHATTQISEAWRHAFEQRWDSNVVRMRDMLVEAKRINSAFRSFGLTAAFLKGFTLTPDFCDHPSLRHQVDIDVLVAPKDTQTAAQALSACGYSASRVNESGE